jgi:molybdopterin-guanine dinucleotide biosynthesis protein A
MVGPTSTEPTGATDPSWAAVVLAGGTSRRWAGRDKTAAPLAGRAVLEHVVAAVLPQAVALAVVAPADHPARAPVWDAARRAGRPLAWTREDPPGGGPLSGLAAGLAALSALRGRGGPPEIVVLLAGDLPFARTACPRLAAALAAPAIGDGDGGHAVPDTALGVDPGGRAQPLLAAYRTTALRRRLATLDPVGRPVRDLLTGLVVTEVPVTAAEALDLDTPQDAETAERLLATARY